MVRHQIVCSGCSNSSVITAGDYGTRIMLLGLMVSSIFTDVLVEPSKKKALILDDLI